MPITIQQIVKKIGDVLNLTEDPIISSIKDEPKMIVDTIESKDDLCQNHSNDDLYNYNLSNNNSFVNSLKLDLNIFWDDINIALDTACYNEKREKSLANIANHQTVFNLKLHAYNSGERNTKIEFICKNESEAIMAQNLFILPSKDELMSFGVEDYCIIVDISPDENYTIKNTLDVNLAKREVLIRGNQPIHKMEPGVFYVLNGLMKRP